MPRASADVNFRCSKQFLKDLDWLGEHSGGPHKGSTKNYNLPRHREKKKGKKQNNETEKKKKIKKRNHRKKYENNKR